MMPHYILGEHLVFAHTMPTEYSILPDSITKLEKFPSNISIMFSERPDPKISHIHLLDLKNQRIDNNDFRISGQDGRLGTITLDKSKMSDDSYYSVSWFAMSLDDGHTSKGTFTVGVGDVTKKMFESNTNWDQAVEGGIVTSTIDGIIRAPLMVSQIFVAGAIISQIYLLRKFRYGSHMESILTTNHNFVHRFVVLTVVSCVITIFLQL
jgi:methionine-rich copper-binding protein CopC